MTVSKSKGSKDHWRGAYGWEFYGIGHTKRRNEQKRRERRRARRAEKRELTRLWEQES